jgi:4-hydroxybenzoyl-CoA thioesterase
MGEKLAFHLSVEHIGKSALMLRHRIVGPDGKLRWRARQRLVATSLDTHRSTPWPDDIRTAIHRFMENL